MFYSAGMPLINFFAVVYFSLAYWCDKATLLMVSKKAWIHRFYPGYSKLNSIFRNHHRRRRPRYLELLLFKLLGRHLRHFQNGAKCGSSSIAPVARLSGWLAL
jgi:hypothetical protein